MDICTVLTGEAVRLDKSMNQLELACEDAPCDVCMSLESEPDI